MAWQFGTAAIHSTGADTAVIKTRHMNALMEKASATAPLGTSYALCNFSRQDD